MVQNLLIQLGIHTVLFLIEAAYLNGALISKYKNKIIFFGYIFLNILFTVPSIIKPSVNIYFGTAYYIAKIIYVFFLYKNSVREKIIAVVVMFCSLFLTEYIIQAILSAYKSQNRRSVFYI